MSITKVKVSGFKGHQNEVRLLDPVLTGLNVIIGPNGAGKSNLLQAIDVALSNTLGRMNEKAVHELVSNANRRMNNGTANIQVELDNRNKDYALPDRATFKCEFGKTGAPKFYLNGQQFDPKHHPMLISQAVNCIYKINQGDIGRFATDADGIRLKMLKELTNFKGTEEWKAGLFHEVAPYETNVTLLELEVEYIEEELKQYEDDRDVITKHQALTQQRDTLNFCIVLKEFLKHKERRDQAGPKSKKFLDLIGRLQENVGVMNRKLGEQDSQLTEVSRELNQLTLRKERMNERLTSVIQRVTALKNDLPRRTMSSPPAACDDVTKELSTVEDNLAMKAVQLKSLEAKQEATYSKVAKSIAKVDFLMEVAGRGTVANAANLKKKKTADLEKLKMELENVKQQGTLAQQKFQQEEDGIASVLKELQDNWTLISDNRGKIEGYKMDLHNINKTPQVSCNDVWDRKAEVQRELDTVRDKLRQVDTSLRMYMGYNFESYSRVPLIIESFRRSANAEDRAAAAGYYGVVFENIMSVPEELETAVEVSAAKKMYHHIVDSRLTGNRIVKEYNMRKYPGEINVLVEGNIQQFKAIPDQYVRMKRAERLVQKLNYRPEVANSMGLIFNNYLLVPDVFKVKPNPKIRATFISIDGDTVRSNGPITGGYRDPAKSVLRAHKTKVELLKKQTELVKQLKAVNKEEATCTQQNSARIAALEKIKMKASKLELEIEALKTKCDGLIAELASAEARLPNLLIAVTQKRQAEQILRERINLIEEDIRNEFSRPGENPVAAREEEKKKLSAAKLEYEKVMTERKELEKEVLGLRLQRRYLASAMGNSSAGSSGSGNLAANWTSFANIQKLLEDEEKVKLNLLETLKKLEAEEAAAASKEKHLSDEIGKTQELIHQSSEKLVKAKADLEAAWYDRFGELERSLLDKVRKLGRDETELTLETGLTMPEFAKSSTDLFKELLAIKEELKKAELPFRRLLNLDKISVEVAKLEDQLFQAKESLERAKEVVELIVDCGPSLSMWIIKNIQIIFPDIYTEIATGSGNHHDNKRAELTLYSENENEEYSLSTSNAGPDAESEAAWGNVKFLGAKLELIGRNDIRHDIRTLSGGQRSVLAIAFLLAVQDSCPSKIYLFDEIDQALDEQYRGSVARLLKQTGNRDNVQFFCTTFSRDFVSVADRVFYVKTTGTTTAIERISVQEALQLEFLGDNSAIVRGPPPGFVLVPPNSPPRTWGPPWAAQQLPARRRPAQQQADTDEDNVTP